MTPILTAVSAFAILAFVAVVGFAVGFFYRSKR